MRVQRFSISLTIIVLLFLGLLLSLGFWQLDRAKQKLELIDRFVQRFNEPAYNLSEVRTEWKTHIYRRVQLSGHFLPDLQIQLQNQIRHGRAGIHSYRPFRSEEGVIMLVNLGWYESSHQFDPISTEKFTFEALLRSPPQVGLRLGDLDRAPFSQPIRIPYLDIDWIAKRLDLNLEPFVLLLQSDDTELEEWMPVRIPPEKHHGYALTWFSLAFALLILFGIFTFKTENTENEIQ